MYNSMNKLSTAGCGCAGSGEAYRLAVRPAGRKGYAGAE